MIYYVDIDNTICYTTETNYYSSIPIIQRIDTINRLFHDGHTIIYWTARGSKSGKDWSTFTTQQLDSWGCLYHSIIFGKPAYDLYIDDKSINSELFFNDKKNCSNR